MRELECAQGSKEMGGKENALLILLALLILSSSPTTQSKYQSTLSGGSVQALLLNNIWVKPSLWPYEMRHDMGLKVTVLILHCTRAIRVEGCYYARVPPWA